MLHARVRALLVLAMLLGASLAAIAHNRLPAWLEDGALDRGLFLEVRHAGVIRKAKGFSVRVLVANVGGSREARVLAVRYIDPATGAADSRVVDHVLPGKQQWLDEFHAVDRRLSELEGAAASAEQAELAQRSLALMAQIADGAFTNEYAVEPGDFDGAKAYRLVVEVEVQQGRQTRTLRREVEIPIAPPLPSGRPPRSATDLASTAAVAEQWYAGDQHLHTQYSVDAYFTNGNRSNVADYAAVAEAAGLDWIVVTDHSNISFGFLGNNWYTPQQFAAGTAEAEAYRNQTGFLVFNGQEMGAGSGDPAHVLAYPFASDTTGFLPNPCTGGLFGQNDCESRQQILDRINGAGGLGFIAHPFQSSGGFFGPWNFQSGATGWAGFEIFNSTDGVLSAADREALLTWFQLLSGIDPPVGGELPARDDYPNRFPVGIGNSDAHEPSVIGKTFTYCQAADASRDAIMSSLADGRCVASNGPLSYLEINGAGPGRVASVTPGPTNTLSVTIQSTPEFGPAGSYTVYLFVNGQQQAKLSPTGTPDFTSTTVFEDIGLGGGIRYIVVAAVGASGGLSIANPVWIDEVGE